MFRQIAIYLVMTTSAHAQINLSGSDKDSFQQKRAEQVVATAGPDGFYDPDTQMILWKEHQNPYAIVNAALWYAIEGDFKKSQSLYRLVIKKLETAAQSFPKEYNWLLATAHHNYAVCELYNRRFDTAGAYFVKATRREKLKPTMLNIRLVLSGGLVKQKNVLTDLRSVSIGEDTTGPDCVVWASKLHPKVESIKKTSLQHLLERVNSTHLVSRLVRDRTFFKDRVIEYVIRSNVTEIDRVGAATDGTNSAAVASRTRISSTRVATTYDVRIDDEFIPLLACIRCAGKGVETCPNPDCRRGVIVGSQTKTVGRDIRGNVKASGLVNRKTCSTCDGATRVKCGRCGGGVIRVGG